VAGSRVVVVMTKNFCLKFFVGGNVEEAVDKEEAILVNLRRFAVARNPAAAAARTASPVFRSSSANLQPCWGWEA
jgi:hypothetical protein